MLIFRTDPAAPDGWSRLERCVLLGVHAAPRSTLRFCISGKVRFHEYLKSRRIPILTVPQWEKIPVSRFHALVIDTCRWNEVDLRMATDFKNAGIPVLAVRDPGDPETPYADWVLGGSLLTDTNSDTGGFPGPILHPRFRHVHSASRFYHHRVLDVLIHLEDRIRYRELKRMVETLSRYGYRIRIGPMPGVKKNLKSTLSRKFPRIRWVGKVECMARAMANVDIAVIAPAAATFEAAATGTPAIYLSSNEVEIQAALKLEGLGLGKTIRHPRKTPLLDIISSMDRTTRAGMGDRGKRLVDGMGLFRTLDFLRREHIITGMKGETVK